jgi:hypothetical protein
MAQIPGYRLLAGLAVVLSAGCTAVVVAATPAAAATDLVTAFGSSPQSGSEPTKQAEAVCPAGRQVLGGGADIVNGGNGVRVSVLVPDQAKHSYVVVGTEDARGYDGSWTINAFAVCGTVTGYQVVNAGTASAPGESDVSAQADCFPQSPDETFPVFAYAICANPQPGQQMVFSQTAAGPGDKIATVTCPSGTRVHGAGGGLSGALGQAHFDRIGINGAGGLGGTDVDARADLDGTAQNWSAWAFAICAA